MDFKQKKHETIGACGIDCGLCPRFYTKGDSVCPGCGGLNFKEKHPSCGLLTCVVKQGLETCGECKDYPCQRFENTVGCGADSFVTHKKMRSNLDEIRAGGIEKFIKKQNIRIDILRDFLTNYDDGRTKSFFCQTCALLPIDSLQKIHHDAKNILSTTDLKERSKHIRKIITETATSLGVDLKLNKLNSTL